MFDADFFLGFPEIINNKLWFNFRVPEFHITNFKCKDIVKGIAKATVISRYPYLETLGLRKADECVEMPLF